MSTPQGMRSRQTMDMLNSDWSIEPAGVKTLAAPDQVDDITYRMKWIWWDRPFKLTGIDIGAGQSTLHVTNSYGVNQDIQLHVDGNLWRWDGRTACTAQGCPGWSLIDREARTVDMQAFVPVSAPSRLSSGSLF